jgi:S1/P1 Nuclease
MVMISGFCFGYGVTGHRVVAEIAQRHLAKKTLRELRELIGGEGLAYWSNWPDFIKSDTTGTWKAADRWHYVNLTANQARATFADSLKGFAPPNLYTQIPAMIAQVKDKTLPLEKRRQALYFLVHFIGDLHQPLHVGRPEDLGANRINVMWFDKKTNLHSVWDSDLVNFQQYSFTEYATVLNVVDKDRVKELQQGTLEDWFFESHTQANNIYQRSPNDSNLGYRYNYLFQAVLEDQLLKGGLRLARVLNEAFE